MNDNLIKYGALELLKCSIF